EILCGGGFVAEQLSRSGKFGFNLLPTEQKESSRANQSSESEPTPTVSKQINHDPKINYRRTSVAVAVQVGLGAVWPWLGCPVEVFPGEIVALTRRPRVRVKIVL